MRKGKNCLITNACWDYTDAKFILCWDYTDAKFSFYVGIGNIQK